MLFRSQFDEDGNYGLDMREFAACMNFIRNKIQNKDLMFKLLAYTKMGSITTNSGEAPKFLNAEADIDIYRKAFLQMREFDNRDPSLDIITFKQMLPFLFCFFVSFEILSINKRKSLYNQCKFWIISAFKEASSDANVREAKKEDEIAAAKLLIEKDSINSYTYEQVITALTILQSRHNDNFGHAEFQVITESLQKIFEVDPITFKSPYTAPLTSNKVFLSPLLTWENDITHKSFKIGRAHV